MIALLADEDFNGRIIRGLLRRMPDLDLLTVHGANLAAQVDPIILSWAAENGRVLLTHDANTMISAALDRVRMNQTMSGVIFVGQRVGIGRTIADLVLIATIAEPEDLQGRIWHLPL